MKNTTLALFAGLIILGWAPMAAGVLAVFSGAPEVTARAHNHQPPPPPVLQPQPQPELEPGNRPLVSGTRCPAGEQAPDAAVPCAA